MRVFADNNTDNREYTLEVWGTHLQKLMHSALYAAGSFREIYLLSFANIIGGVILFGG